ncbi:MAG TPA: hypothetical protein VGG69_06410 [Rhizomicrobium sp.]
MVGRFTVLPARHFDRLATHAQAASGATLPLWSRAVSTGGVRYVYDMVGRNPFVTQTVTTTNIKAVVIPIVFTFTSWSNTVFDPTHRDVACSPAGPARTLTQASPLFNPVVGYPGGTYVGTGQYVDLFQRANYFSQTNPSGINPDYHVNLTYTPNGGYAIPVSGGDVITTPCGGHLGLIDISTWDNYIQTTLFPALAAHSPPIAPPNTLPIFLLYNVVLYDGSFGNCCILGYHSAFNDPAYANAFHTYSSVEFDATQEFSGVSDISAMSHEIAEWMDDPAGNNPTPSWGNIGQVTGCQANLEVGDPLSGTLTQIYMPSNGYTYHVQDFTFTSWFYRQKPSTGVNGWYSFLGSFLTPSAPC